MYFILVDLVPLLADGDSEDRSDPVNSKVSDVTVVASEGTVYR